MDEKINKEINRIRGFIKERQEILIVVVFVIALASLIGSRIYSDRAKETEEIKTKLECHYQAVKKAQEKYKKEFLSFPGCKDCKQKEEEGLYLPKDYELYYSECLINR